MLEWLEQFYNSKSFAVITLLRMAFLLGLAVLLLIIGMMIGYSVLGEGGNPFSIFSGDVWRKIFDFVH